MLVFFYGQNSYSLLKGVKKLVERYQKKYPNSFNFYKFDLEDDDWKKIKEAIISQSFFGEIKFIIIKNVFSKTNKNILKIIDNQKILKEKNIVILVYQTESGEDLKNKDKSLFQFLSRSSQTKEFKIQNQKKLARFALGFLKENGISIQKIVLDKIIKEIGEDQWRLDNELNKIVNYALKMGKRNIDFESIVNLINFRDDPNIFEFIDSIFSNKFKSIYLLENYLTRGENPVYILVKIADQLKKLILIKSLLDKKYQFRQILEKTKIHPFVFKKAYQISKKFSLNDLKSMFQELAELEVSFKKGLISGENMLLKFLL